MCTVQIFKFAAIFICLSSCSTRPEPPTETGKSNELRTAHTVTINTLTGKIENLELEYIVWGCACANWILPLDRVKYQNSGLAAHCIFLEPADSSLNIPENFDAYRNKLQVKGQYYVIKGYPKGLVQGEEGIGKAKVFRYTELRMVNR